MVILGLTGSIGMGKTTAAAMLLGLGVPVFDSDAVVHALFAPGGAAVAPLSKAFPEAVADGTVDRDRLGKTVLGDAAALARLESIVHPLVRQAQARFLRQQAARRRDLVVLDVPLLFETGGDARCDAVICLTAPPWLQRARVLARPGMTADKLAGVLARQMPDAEKRRRADFVVQTGSGRRHTLKRLSGIVTVMRCRKGTHWPPRARPRKG